MVSSLFYRSTAFLYTLLFHFCFYCFVPIVNLMVYIPKTDDYLEMLTNEEVNDFVAINLSEYFKSIREQ